MRIHVGTSGYAYKEWKGIFYPEKISPKGMLRFYGEHLDAVEINYTFHHMPTERVIAPWGEQVPGDFVFAFKAPQVMTHVKKLRSVGEEAEYLFRTLSVLGGRLGPVLFQFPKFFHANKNLPVLEEFLGLIPENILCAFDFRSSSWLEAGVADLLGRHGCGLCLEDTDENPVQEIIGTAPWGYLRLRRAEYAEADLSQWLERIRAQGWERVFVFFKHEEDEAGPILGPKLALRFQELVDQG